ncbi:MAG: exosortase/archaeosortase family protein, partial [Chloroflexi bacterium]|nr:exosortase/archaeosortase family protein [Chloroflexota bacterium]
SVVVTPGCAGYSAIGVFISLFTLMMLDVRLPAGKAWYVFLIGLAGTWLQNILRIMVLVSAGYYWGPAAFDLAHYNAAYIIFPAWFALFAFFYLRQCRRRGHAGTAPA